MVRQLATCIINKVMDRVLNAGTRSEQGEWLAFEVWRLRIAEDSPQARPRSSEACEASEHVRSSVDQVRCISLMWGV